MDMRVGKTVRSITNAFLELRSRKPLEKITVRELSERAEINKATFYLHYHDIYELSEFLERDVVKSTINAIAHPETIFSDPRRFVRELSDSFIANEQLIKLLFKDSRSSSFVSLLESELTRIIESHYPDYRIDIEDRMMMTYLIYGGYYTYFKYCDNGIKPVLELIEKLSGGIVTLYEQKQDKPKKA